MHMVYQSYYVHLSLTITMSISYYNYVYFFPSLDETEHEKLYGEAG